MSGNSQQLTGHHRLLKILILYLVLRNVMQRDCNRQTDILTYLNSLDSRGKFETLSLYQVIHNQCHLPKVFGRKSCLERLGCPKHPLHLQGCFHFGQLRLRQSRKANMSLNGVSYRADSTNGWAISTEANGTLFEPERTNLPHLFNSMQKRGLVNDLKNLH